jgi:heme-degrading monooxygenase HmoA
MGWAYIWEYRVAAAEVAAFARTYGPEGPWVALFRGQPGYRRTVLLEDESDPRRFVTIDFWASREDFERFHACHREAFGALDAQCERLTESERRLGGFRSPSVAE